MFIMRNTKSRLFISLKKEIEGLDLFRTIISGLNTIEDILLHEKNNKLVAGFDGLFSIQWDEEFIEHKEVINSGKLPIIVEGIDYYADNLINRFLKVVKKKKLTFNDNEFLKWLTTEYKKSEDLIKEYKLTDNKTVLTAQVGDISYKYIIDRSYNGVNLKCNYEVPLYEEISKKGYLKTVDISMLHVAEHIVAEGMRSFYKYNYQDLSVDASTSYKFIEFEISDKQLNKTNFFSYKNKSKELLISDLFEWYAMGLTNNSEYFRIDDFKKHLMIVAEEENIHKNTVSIPLEEDMLTNYLMKKEYYFKKYFHKEFKDNFEDINKFSDDGLKCFVRNLSDLVKHILYLPKSIVISTSEEISIENFEKFIVKSFWDLFNIVDLKADVVKNLHKTLKDKYDIYEPGMTLLVQHPIHKLKGKKVSSILRQVDENQMILSSRSYPEYKMFKGENFLVFDVSNIMFHNPAIYNYNLHNHNVMLLSVFMLFVITKSFNKYNFVLDVARHSYGIYGISYNGISLNNVIKKNGYNQNYHVFILEICKDFKGDLIEDFLDKLIKFIKMENVFDYALDQFKSGLLDVDLSYEKDNYTFLYDYDLLKNIDRYLTLETFEQFINRLKNNNCITRIDIK